MACKTFRLTLLLIASGLTSSALGGEADFYELLGVDRSASTREIRKAFKKIALEKHPDKNQDDPEAHEKFLRINRAYEVLKDDDLRKKYDIHGEEGLKEEGPTGRGYRSWHFYQQEFGIYDNDEEIITLSRSDFEMSVKNTEDIWFINFYSPMCSHCHDLAPTWREVAQELEGVVRIGAVNCGDDRMLCRNEGITGYPSLVMYPRREKFSGDRTKDEILKFALRHANTEVIRLWYRNFDQVMAKPEFKSKPWLITYCGDGGDCLEENALLKVSAMLEDLVTVGSMSCHGNEDLCEKLGIEHGTYYYGEGIVEKGRGEEIRSLHAQEVAQAVLNHLPNLPLLAGEAFQERIEKLKQGSGRPLLTYFFDKDDPNLELRKLPALLNNIEVARVDCRLARSMCRDLYLLKLPVFALFKRRGGYEVHHGRLMAHDIAIFAKDVAMTTMSTLSPDDFPAVVESGTPWMIDFFSPLCPPCLRLLPELRKASRAMADIKFGTLDCSLHGALCSEYNVRSYPTAIFYNESTPHHFVGHHYAQDIIDFIQDTLNPPVILLDDTSFHQLVQLKSHEEIWLVDFYAPWCGPCRQMLPEWTRLAKSFKDSTMFQVASVDCVKYSSLCADNGIHSYPSIRLYPQGQFAANSWHQYNGWFRDAHNFKNWALGFKPSKVVQLTYDAFAQRVLLDPRPWIVDFYTPWCGHCRRFAPHFEHVAEVLEGRVMAGKVDCDNHRQLCATASIRAYPTVYFYPGAPPGIQQGAVGEFIDSQDSNHIIHFLEQKLVHRKRVKQGQKDEL